MRWLLFASYLAGCSFSPTAAGQQPIDSSPAPPGTDGHADGAPVDAPVTVDTLMIDAAPVSVDLPMAQDTYIDSLNANTAFGGNTTMLVDGSTQPAVTLWRVDLTTIPSSATIQVAELHVTVGNDTGDASTVFEMLESWSEGNATWNQRDTATAWTGGAGAKPGSRGTTAIGGPVGGSPSGDEKVVAIDLAVVGDWVATPATNFGAAMVMATSNGATYRTTEDGTATRRPFLHLVYVP